MKTIKGVFLAVLMLTILSGTNSYGQETPVKKSKSSDMKTYVIEREMPGAHQLTGEELKGASQKSCTVIDELGPKIKWMHSYVSEDKIYCVYQAKDKEILKKHAEKSGFPANSIKEVATTISPKTAE